MQKGWFGDRKRWRLVEYFKRLVNSGLGNNDLINRAVALLVTLVELMCRPHVAEAVARPLLGNGSVLIVFIRICIGQAFNRHLHL